MEENMIKHFDIIVLHVILNHDARFGVPPTQKELAGSTENSFDGLVNQFIESNEMPIDYSQSTKSVKKIILSIERLRKAGLITTSGRYRPTKEAKTFISKLPNHWSDWPMTVNVVNGIPQSGLSRDDLIIRLPENE